MLQAENNVHAADAEGDLPLHVAAACGSVTSVRLLLAASARVGAENLRLETTQTTAVDTSARFSLHFQTWKALLKDFLTRPKPK